MRDVRLLQIALLGALTGTLQGLTWPLSSVLIFNFVFFVPFMLMLAHVRSGKEAAVLALSHGMVGTSIGFYWLADMAVSFGGFPEILSPIIVLLYATVGQGQLLIFALITFLLWRRGLKLPLLFYPALFVALDSVYPKIFCDTQGAVLFQWHSLIQIAEHVGVYGLTFLVFWWNVSVASLLSAVVPKIHSPKLPSRFSAVLNTAACVVVIVAAHFWGSARIEELKAIEGKWSGRLKVAVMQANIGDADKLASEQGSMRALAYVLDTYSGMTRQAVAQHKPDLIVWPETSYPYLYTHFQDVRANARGEARDAWMATLMDEIKTPLYFGGYSHDGVRDYNTAFLLKDSKTLIGAYRKSKLLAFGETVPLGPLGPFVKQAIPAIGDFGRGPGPTVFDFPYGEGKSVKLGPLICYESIIPSYPLETARKGAQVFLNITNDSWFGDTSEPVSHLILTAFRSIELRRPLLRGTNTGITTVFDITGRAHDPTSLFAKETFVTEIRYPGGGEEFPVGLYYRFGAWFEWTCAVFALLVSVLAMMPRLKFKKL